MVGLNAGNKVNPPDAAPLQTVVLLILLKVTLVIISGKVQLVLGWQ